MRIKIFLLSLLVGTMAASAQFSWGVGGGVGTSHAFDTNKTRTSFNIGVTGEVSLPLGFFVDGSLRLANRQWADCFAGPESTGIRGCEKVNPYYLELPIMVGKKFTLVPKLKLGVAIGPKVGWGLFGPATSVQYNSDGTSARSKFSNCFNSNAGATMGRFEAGGQAKLFLQVADHYRIGLEGDIVHYSKAKKNRASAVDNAWQLGLNLTYMF